MSCNKAFPNTVPSSQLPVKRTLQNRLHGGVDVEAEFDRRHAMLERHLHQTVNRGLVEGKGEQFHDSSSGLDEPLILAFKLQSIVVMDLRASAFCEGPSVMVIATDALQPCRCKPALDEGRIEDTHVLSSFWWMVSESERSFVFTG